MIKAPISFINKFQEDVFYETKRNICASGAYGNGKTYACCEKLIFLATKFPNYKCAILRRSGTDLNRTTKVTFFKICPPELYDEKKGGKWNEHKGYLKLINGSEFQFLHLDKIDENVVRGLEINSAFIDQAEEIDENIASHLDSRVGRWDKALPPKDKIHDFSRNPVTGTYDIPSYMLLGCNPEGTDHWIYQQYHPDSDYHNELLEDPETKEKYRLSDTHVMYQAAITENPAVSKELKRTLSRKSKSFRDRFYYGRWGITEGSIHELSKDSLLNYEEIPPGFLNEITHKGSLFRVMDYGSTAPTCVLWFSAYKKWVICYREYYRDKTLISEHRRNIHELSVLPGSEKYEQYTGEFADPSIFGNSMQKKNQFWSVADEFVDKDLDAPPIFWRTANNDEYMTRNRIDEMLTLDMDIAHPITGEMGAPKLYFLRFDEEYNPYGCREVIKQTRAQRRVKTGVINGEDQFSEQRDKTVLDHAYDPLRYLVGTRPDWREYKTKRKPGGNTFFGLREAAIRNKFRSNGQSPSTAPHVLYQLTKDRLGIT